MRRLLLPPLLTTLAFAALLLVLHFTGILGFVYDREALRAWVANTGALAPAAFLLLLCLRPFTLFPALALAPVAAELFGVWQGTALKVLGETIGGLLAFLTARYGFSRALSGMLRRIAPSLGRSLDSGVGYRLGSLLERRGARAVLALRSNLLLPFDALNYGLGFTTLRAWAFCVGTFLGIIPGTFLYVSLSGTALQGDWRRSALIIAGILLMLWLSVPLARELLAGRDTTVSLGERGDSSAPEGAPNQESPE